MAYSQYSEHRRPTAVPKVPKVQRFDTTGEDDLKVQRAYEKAMEQNAPKVAPKRSFADLIKKKK